MARNTINSAQQKVIRERGSQGAMFHAKASAYENAYYPSEIRGKVKVEVDYKEGKYNLSKTSK